MTIDAHFLPFLLFAERLNRHTTARSPVRLSRASTPAARNSKKARRFRRASIPFAGGKAGESGRLFLNRRFFFGLGLALGLRAATRALG